MKVNLTTALQNPEKCCVCQRKVNTASLDNGRATFVVVNTDGELIDGRNGYNLVVGSECRKTAGV